MPFPYVIAIDFDGTIVAHKYPEIGEPALDAFYWMKRWHKEGARLILSTVRSGDELEEAVEFCKSNGVTFWGVNENLDQASWSSSPKIYANIYVDDAAFGCPLILGGAGQPLTVDWSQIGPALIPLILEHYGCPVPQPSTSETVSKS